MLKCRIINSSRDLGLIDSVRRYYDENAERMEKAIS